MRQVEEKGAALAKCSPAKTEKDTDKDKDKDTDEDKNNFNSFTQSLIGW